MSMRRVTIASQKTPVMVLSDGPEIIATNYFNSVYCQHGMYAASFNAGAARLLVPSGMENGLLEMATGDHVVISFGKWNPRVGVQGSAMELLFEDHSDSPFAIQISRFQYDRRPAHWDHGRTDLRLLVYTAGPTLRLNLPAKVRDVPVIPWLQEWS